MAILSKSLLFNSITGKLGDLVFRRVGSKTIISRAPQFHEPATAEQQKQRARFKEAVAFAKSQMEDPELKAAYKLLAKKKGLPNAYNAAIAAFFSKLRDEEGKQ